MSHEKMLETENKSRIYLVCRFACERINLKCKHEKWKSGVSCKQFQVFFLQNLSRKLDPWYR